jgi:hypothetical protein
VNLVGAVEKTPEIYSVFAETKSNILYSEFNVSNLSWTDPVVSFEKTGEFVGTIFKILSPKQFLYQSADAVIKVVNKRDGQEDLVTTISNGATDSFDVVLAYENNIVFIIQGNVFVNFFKDTSWASESTKLFDLTDKNAVGIGLYVPSALENILIVAANDTTNVEPTTLTGYTQEVSKEKWNMSQTVTLKENYNIQDGVLGVTENSLNTEISICFISAGATLVLVRVQTDLSLLEEKTILLPLATDDKPYSILNIITFIDDMDVDNIQIIVRQGDVCVSIILNEKLDQVGEFVSIFSGPGAKQFVAGKPTSPNGNNQLLMRLLNPKNAAGSPFEVDAAAWAPFVQLSVLTDESNASVTRND